MNIKTIKTEKVTPGLSLFYLLDQNIHELKEKSILAITSKVVAISEGSIIDPRTISKDDLIKKEADYYINKNDNIYDVYLTIKNNIIIPSAGIDESNGNGRYILWPKDVQQTANEIRHYLQRKYSLKNIGIVITESKTTPLRWGTTGIGLAWSGFKPLKSYIGEKDIFGRTMKMSVANIVDGLAAATVLVMGEGNEQTPLATISDIPFIEFVNRDPSQQEINNFQIDKKDDLYSPIISSVKWHKGGK